MNGLTDDKKRSVVPTAQSMVCVCVCAAGYSTSDLSASGGGGVGGGGGEDRVFLVHANVPASTADALGVPTLVSKMLDAEQLDYSFSSFGQSDSLTHRLHTLLDDHYADGFAVPKELVQNADDAGATEVKTTRLLTPPRGYSEPPLLTPVQHYAPKSTVHL